MLFWYLVKSLLILRQAEILGPQNIPKSHKPLKVIFVTPALFCTLYVYTTLLKKTTVKNGWTPQNWFQILTGFSNGLELFNLKLSKTNLHTLKKSSLIA